MAATMKLLCLLLLVGIAHSWAFPSNDFPGFFNTNSTSLSVINDINKMMGMMHKRFQRLFANFPSFSMDHMDNWIEDRKQLDAIQPNCTTTTTTSDASTSIQKNRRKKLRNTQTTTCIKELIIDGKKQMYKEVNITDEKGHLISQSKFYQTISLNTNNNTLPTEDKNVISY